MALTSQAKTDCPAGDEAPFATLGDVDRLGVGFCAEPHASELLGGVQGYRAFRMRCLATTLRILHACGPPRRSVVSLRLKRLDSVRRKLTRRGANFKLGTLDDVIGVRVICRSVSDLIALSTRLKSSPHIHRVKDYIEAPAATGYRAIHHIMRFQQLVSADRSLAVRFEIQARTYLQHRWAVWSEAHGERAKIGRADVARHQQLRAVSEDVTRWEKDNPACTQHDLLPYSGVRTVAVCWRPAHGPATPSLFHDDVGAAVSWLNHLETAYPARRENALLLVGIAEHADISRALPLTHPLYVGARVAHPRFYIPAVSP